MITHSDVSQVDIRFGHPPAPVAEALGFHDITTECQRTNAGATRNLLRPTSSSARTTTCVPLLVVEDDS